MGSPEAICTREKTRIATITSTIKAPRVRANKNFMDEIMRVGARRQASVAFQKNGQAPGTKFCSLLDRADKLLNLPSSTNGT